MKLSGVSIFVKYENRDRPCPRIYRSIFITRQAPRLLQCPFTTCEQADSCEVQNVEKARKRERPSPYFPRSLFTSLRSRHDLTPVSNVCEAMLACTQTLFYFSFRSFRKHRRARERSDCARTSAEREIENFSFSPTPTPLHWRSINLLRFTSYHPGSTDFKEKIEDL